MNEYYPFCKVSDPMRDFYTNFLFHHKITE